MAERFQTYAEFWPFYLGEHAKPSTRAVHYVGSIASVVVLIVALATRNWWLLLSMCAWVVCGWLGLFAIGVV